MVLEFLLQLVLDPGGLLDDIRDGRRERRARRLARSGRIRCALRVVEGAQPGLGRRWKRGTARVPPGRLVFEHGILWQGLTTVLVRTAVLQPTAALRRRERRALGPKASCILLTTAGATLEWLVPEGQVERAMRVTRRSVREGRPPAG